MQVWSGASAGGAHAGNQVSLFDFIAFLNQQC
jgi:hypothetical protein